MTRFLVRRKRISFAVAGLAFAAAGLIGAPAAVATPSADAVDAIDAKYTTFGGAGSLLGTPIAAAVDVGAGAERDYSGGVIYYSKDSGAKVMYGAILDRYKALGGPTGDLGFPTNDESDAGNGVARFNDFTAPGGASIYWSPEWGAMVLKGRVRDAWLASGGVNGPFGYPTTDTTTLSDAETGKFIGPAGTEIQWSDAAGLVTVPAGLAASLPGFRATAPSVEGTPSVTGSATYAERANDFGSSSDEHRVQQVVVDPDRPGNRRCGGRPALALGAASRQHTRCAEPPSDCACRACAASQEICGRASEADVEP